MNICICYNKSTFANFKNILIIIYAVDFTILCGQVVTFFISSHRAWSQWSECFPCSLPGRKRRFGHCMVRRLKTSSPSKPEIVDRMLDALPDGVPCHVSALKSVSDIYNLKDEDEVRRCHVKCKKEGRKYWEYTHWFSKKEVKL